MVGQATDSLSECELSGANDDRHFNESCFVVTKAECMMAVVGTCVVEIHIDVSTTLIRLLHFVISALDGFLTLSAAPAARPQWSLPQPAVQPKCVY